MRGGRGTAGFDLSSVTCKEVRAENDLKMRDAEVLCMYELNLDFCLGYRKEIWGSVVSDCNLGKVLKEGSKAWWNLFFLCGLDMV